MSSTSKDRLVLLQDLNEDWVGDNHIVERCDDSIAVEENELATNGNSNSNLIVDYEDKLQIQPGDDDFVAFDRGQSQNNVERIDSQPGNLISTVNDNCDDIFQLDGMISDFVASESIQSNRNGLEEYRCSNLIESPGGSTHWIPVVADRFRPVIGTLFGTFEDAKRFYDTYAEKAGFDTRLSTIRKVKDVVTHRYIVCNRQGKSRKKNMDSVIEPDKIKLKRKRSFKATNCMARLILKSYDGISYVIFKFSESHNHPLIEDENMDLSKSRRQLQYPEQQFIQRLSQSSVGPSVAYRIRALASGGNDMVRGTPQDWRNFRRDVKLFIGERDAEMIVKKMVDRRSHVPNFSFEYKVEDSELTGLFWADEIAKMNYSSFSDIIAFDATYHTNMYDMIFVPFTGIDHHKSCVIFGAGLIASESKESYKWLLECFLEAHQKQPNIVLTDQDPSMKDVVPAVFTESVHRLCTWHITNKIPWKIKGDSDNNTTLRSAIHKLVWNTDLTPAEFEERWAEVIEEYDVKNHKWLNDMYNMKEKWIPGYFLHVPMSCLMKTTSRAESTNSFFKVHSDKTNTLVQFMSCYESAIDSQRYTQRILNNETRTTTPAFRTHLNVERCAANIYTRQMFYSIQKEIWKGVWRCSQVSVDKEDDTEVCVIKDKEKENQLISHFKVTVDRDNELFECSCKNFIKFGFLCRHVFCVFKDRSIDVIPEMYIHPRWRMKALPEEVYRRQPCYGSSGDEGDALMAEAVSIVERCATRLRGNIDKFQDYVKKMKNIMEDVFEQIPTDPDVNKKGEVIKKLVGVSPLKDISFKAKQDINNKGNRTSKRLVGKDENIREQKTKHRRLCSYYGAYDFHDIRTCEIRKEDEAVQEHLQQEKHEKEKRGEAGPSGVKKKRK